MYGQREAQVIQQGSRTFPYAVPAVLHTATNWYDIAALFPIEAALWDYFDAVVVTNYSALPVHFYLDSASNDYYIIPYAAQPITRRAFRKFGLYNPDGANDIAAGLITINMRRLPPNVTPVVNQS